MHHEPNDEPPPNGVVTPIDLARTASAAKRSAGRRHARGPLTRACRLCWDLTPVTALAYGCCAECALVLGEPARDEAGRFTRPRLAAPPAPGRGGAA
jgi:hypothetical protein